MWLRILQRNASKMIFGKSVHESFSTSKISSLLSTSQKCSAAYSNLFSSWIEPYKSQHVSSTICKDFGNKPTQFTLLTVSKNILFQHQSRSITVCSEKTGGKISSQAVLARFKRLGNGLWLRRRAGHRTRLWKKYMKKGGPGGVYRLRRHVLCSKKHTKLLDKMVTDEWKKQRWTVSDPYAGYDLHSKFYYNPFNIPEINFGKTDEKRDYNWQRYQQSLKQNKQAKYTNKRRDGISHRQKPILKNPYFH